MTVRRSSEESTKDVLLVVDHWAASDGDLGAPDFCDRQVFAVVLILSVITDLWRMDSGKLTRTREVPGSARAPLL